jgi:hypothetical protein
MEINPGKCKALRFTKDLFKNPLGYCPDEQKFRKVADVNS